MIRRIVLVVALLMAISLAGLSAQAQVCPVSFGFPTIVHSASSTGFVQDLADATNYQNVAIDFGACGAFPSISQTSLQTQSMSHTEYSQTSEFDAVGYPYVTVGAGPFGGFSCY